MDFELEELDAHVVDDCRNFVVRELAWHTEVVVNHDLAKVSHDRVL